MAAKTTADKLLIKPGTTVWVSDPARLSLLGSLPAGASTAPSRPLREGEAQFTGGR